MVSKTLLPKNGALTRANFQHVDTGVQMPGRAALSNPDGRFESVERLLTTQELHGSIGQKPTSLRAERARRLIQFNESPDIGFSRSINPYGGCEHGCIYCFARPNHNYRGLSSGVDFETQLFYKSNAISLLQQELSHRSYVPRPIAIGVNTDAFQPIERELQLTRQILQVLTACRHPVYLLTKNALILRDLDILKELAADNLVRVGISMTSLSPNLSRTMEPRAAAPHVRLRIIEQLAGAGIPTTCMIAPIIPGLTDDEIEAILESAASAGAGRATYVILRLPYDVKALFYEWVNAHFPDRAAKIGNQLRSIYGGMDYDSNFGVRGRGSGPFSDMIRGRFKRAVRKLSLDQDRVQLRTDLFCSPARPGEQLSLGL